MESYNGKYIVLSLLLVTIFFQVKGHGKLSSPSLNIQNHHVNGDVIKTFQEDNGDVIDCYDIYKQPSLTHPLLKGHQIQLKPQSISKTTPVENSKNISFEVFREYLECPNGYVPIKRTSNEDHVIAQYLNYSTNPWLTNSQTLNHYESMAEIKAHHHGVRGHINVWSVSNVLKDQMSCASIMIRDGPTYETNTIMAGWIVNPDGETRVFTYWNANGPKSSSCYNMHCPGFVQVNWKIHLGAKLRPLSIFDGKQYEIGIQLHQDLETGHWWLTYGTTAVGYWPKSIFTHLQDGANYASWGGHVTSPKYIPSPPMGSGVKPMYRNRHKVAFIRQIKVNYVGSWDNPNYDEYLGSLNGRDCYGLKYLIDPKGYWGYNVVFGGPGGCIE